MVSVKKHILNFASMSPPLWKNVSAPDAAFSYVPFTIQQKGDVFRPNPSFGLRTYALDQIAAGTTYYVSTTGSDAATGLDWAHALRTPYAAFSKADARIVYIGAGYYYRNESGASADPARSMAVIGVGDVYLTSDCRNQADPGTLVGNHYEIPLSRTVRQVFDAATQTSYGGDTRYALQANAAGVDATPGSWYWLSNVLYLRTSDGRAPDTSLHYYEQGIPLVLYNSGAAYNRILYFENIKFRGGDGNQIVYTANGGDLRMYLKDCDMRYAGNRTSTYNAFSVWGATEFIAWNVTLAHSPLYDGFNYKRSGGVVPRAIEYNCQVFDHGDGSTDQPSTSHDGVIIVRIMGKYHDCRGASILADVGGAVPNVGRAWILGSEVYSPTVPASSGGGYVDQGVQAWYDRCYFHDLGAGAKGFVVADANSIIRYRNMRYDAAYSNTNSGTLEAY